MQYIKNIFFALVLVVGLAPISLSAQNNYLKQVKFSDVSASPVGKSKDKAQLQLTLTLDDLQIRSNDRLLLTPILIDKQSREVVFLFPQIELLGHKRDIIQSRREKSDDPAETSTLYTSLRRYNGTPQSVHYSHPFSYSGDMAGTELVLAQQVYGVSRFFVLMGVYAKSLVKRNIKKRGSDTPRS